MALGSSIMPRPCGAAFSRAKLLSCSFSQSLSGSQNKKAPQGGQLISADDVGSFACAAFGAPNTYHGHTIELAAEALTMPEVAQALTRVTGNRVVAVELTPEQAIARGLSLGWVRSQEWSNAVGYCADIASLKQFGIELTSFERWADKHRGKIEITQ